MLVQSQIMLQEVEEVALSLTQSYVLGRMIGSDKLFLLSTIATAAGEQL